MIAARRLSIRCRDCRQRFSGVRGMRLCSACSGVPVEKREARMRFKPVWLPTPEEIRAACLEYQSRWTDEDRRERMRVVPKRIARLVA